MPTIIQYKLTVNGILIEEGTNLITNELSAFIETKQKEDVFCFANPIGSITTYEATKFKKIKIEYTHFLFLLSSTIGTGKATFPDMKIETIVHSFFLITNKPILLPNDISAISDYMTENNPLNNRKPPSWFIFHNISFMSSLTPAQVDEQLDNPMTVFLELP